MKITLITHTPEPQKLIETCARISYESKNDPFDQEVNSKFIRKLIKNGHESPLEHASATFLIEGISRACSHQIVRHRLASFSQKSQRYTDATMDGGFSAGVVMPESVLKAMVNDDGSFNELRDELHGRLNELAGLYHRLVGMGVPKEDARFIIPEGITTSLYMTANFREWRHFLKLRLDRHAQWEIREVARAILDKLCGIATDCFCDLMEGEAITSTNTTNERDTENGKKD